MPAYRSTRRADRSPPKYAFSTHEGDDESPSLTSATPPSRPSHARKQLPTHVPRPRNAFILFRSDFCKRQKMSESGIESNHSHISRIAGHVWNNLDGASKATYKALAAAEKKAHMAMYPMYRYAPAGRPKATRKVNDSGKDQAVRCRQVAELVMSGLEGEDLQKAVKDLDKGVAEMQLTDRTSQPASKHARCYPARLPVVTRDVSVEVDIKEEEVSPRVDFLSPLPEEEGSDAHTSLTSPHGQTNMFESAHPPAPYYEPNLLPRSNDVQPAPHPHLRPGAASNLTLAELYSRNPAPGSLDVLQDSTSLHWRESAPSPPTLPSSPSPLMFATAREASALPELSLCYPDDASASEIELEFDDYLTDI